MLNRYGYDSINGVITYRWKRVITCHNCINGMIYPHDILGYGLTQVYGDHDYSQMGFKPTYNDGEWWIMMDTDGYWWIMMDNDASYGINTS